MGMRFLPSAGALEPARRGSRAANLIAERGPPPNLLAPISLAVILNIKTFGGATLLLVALLIVVTLLHRAPTRPCHHCGRRVRLERRVCRHCGYEFEPIRFGR